MLESWGTPPADTALTVIARSDRSVILRHAPPDNAVFAELRFPAGAFAVQPGTPVRVEVRPRPGVYGLTLATDVPVGEGATITFSYPMHFLAPAEARRRFGGDFAYERALQIGRLTDDRVSLLPSTRPASDYLRAPLPAAGTYVVGAAPR